MGCKTLTKREITIKTLELINVFGGGTPGIKAIADKCDVTEREVYNWSQYMREDAYPEPDNRKKLLRLYNYHCRNHKGDRKVYHDDEIHIRIRVHAGIYMEIPVGSDNRPPVQSKRPQEQTHDPSPKEPLEPTTRPKNPVSIGG